MSGGWDNQGPGNQAWEDGNAVTAAGDTGLNDKMSAQGSHNGDDAPHDFTSKHAGADDSAFACHNCGKDDHKARECPEPKKMTGECFGCGEVGHNKADCPNAKPVLCDNCGEAHKTSKCEAPRKLYRDNVPEMSAETAWAMIKAGSEAREMEDITTAFHALCKIDSDMTYADFEKQLRDKNVPLYVIACEKEMPKGLTNVNLQGKADCKYQVTYSWTAKPRRSKLAVGWPASTEENSERLNDVGEAMPTLQTVCRRCNELGHSMKHCPEEEDDSHKVQIKCDNCGELGHRMRDCGEPRVDRFACRNCGESGHRADECEKPRDESTMECRRCGQVGHSGKNCPDAPARGCRNCGEEGHMAKDCDKPRNPATMQCRNCDEFGHMSKECPKPRDYSRVKCLNCGEMGHTQVRCKNAPADYDADAAEAGAAGKDETANDWEGNLGSKQAEGEVDEVPQVVDEW